MSDARCGDLSTLPKAQRERVVKCRTSLDVIFRATVRSVSGAGAERHASGEESLAIRNGMNPAHGSRKRFYDVPFMILARRAAALLMCGAVVSRETQLLPRKACGPRRRPSHSRAARSGFHFIPRVVALFRRRREFSLSRIPSGENPAFVARSGNAVPT